MVASASNISRCATMSLALDLSAVPPELRDFRRWVGWRCVERDGKRTKEPTDPWPGRRASSTDPGTWAPLSIAERRVRDDGLDGLGIVLGDGLAGLDCDGVYDPLSGTIVHPQA